MNDYKRLHRLERRFLVLYGFALLMAFSPSKALGQVAPLIFLGGLIFVIQVQPRTHLLRFGVLAGILITVAALYYLIGPQFSLINYGLVIVTLSSFLTLLCDFRYLANQSMLRRISNVTLGVLVFEALYGIAQALVGAARNRSFDIANGDMVRGTIEPSFLPTTTGGNAIYAILMSSLLLFVLATGGRRPSLRRIIAYMLILLAWIMASVMHTVLFFGAAIIATLILQQRLRPILATIRPGRLLGWAAIGFGLACAVVLVFVLLPQNLASLPEFVRTSTTLSEEAESGKAVATYRTLFVAPREHPLVPLVGFGPGQYSSRAALMRSGRYLSGGSLGLPPYTSQATEHYIMSIWESSTIRAKESSTFFPFYSWLSLYGEAGLLGVALVGSTMFWALLMLRRRRSATFPYLHLLLTVLMFYIFFLGIQDNYWEFTQAVFPAIICWRLAYTALRNEHWAWVRAVHGQAAPGPALGQPELRGPAGAALPGSTN